MSSICSVEARLSALFPSPPVPPPPSKPKTVSLPRASLLPCRSQPTQPVLPPVLNFGIVLPRWRWLIPHSLPRFALSCATSLRCWFATKYSIGHMISNCLSTSDCVVNVPPCFAAFRRFLQVLYYCTARDWPSMQWNAVSSLFWLGSTPLISHAILDRPWQMRGVKERTSTVLLDCFKAYAATLSIIPQNPIRNRKTKKPEDETSITLRCSTNFPRRTLP